MKQEALNHTKTSKLARILGIEIWGARGILESLWRLTATQAPNGGVGKLDDFDIAAFIGWRKKKPAVLIGALVEAGFLENSEKFRLVIHDWSHHAEDAVHNKLARSGCLFCDGSLPRISRLPKDERERIESARKALIERTPSASSTHDELVPYQALPSLTRPYQAGSAWEIFQKEFPGELKPDWDCKIFLSVILNSQDERVLLENLALWKETRKWKDGYAPSAENFLTKRQWKNAPQVIATPKTKIDELHALAMEGMPDEI